MRIHLYALNWNEELIVPFFLRHYEPLVDRMVIYDDGSDDRSLELLAASPKVELRRFAVHGDSFVLSALAQYNHFWKESRSQADWVIVCNLDEHFYHPHFRDYLEQCSRNQITIIKAKGYQMVSCEMPPPDAVLAEVIGSGVRWHPLDKTAIFNPDAIEEINFDPGRHDCQPQGIVIYPPEIEVKMLHYKYLGLDYLSERSAELGARMRPADRRLHYGHQYDRSPDAIRQNFQEMSRQARPVVAEETGVYR